MQTTTQTQRSRVVQRSLVMSYLGIRKSIGVIGLLLPIVLAVGNMILSHQGLLESLSAYYYSVMRDVWVGALCATGVFLLSYRYGRQDDLAGDLAGICAIGAALFPTAPAGVTGLPLLIGQAHLVFGASFLLILAYFALVLFRKTNPEKPPTRQKLLRNRMYVVCGLTMLVCLALLGLMQFQPGPTWLQGLHPAFWLESLAIWAFGLAWFIKGETLLKDR